MIRILSLIVPLGLSLVACSRSDQNDPLLKEAAKFHNEATQIQAVIEPKMEQIDSLKTLLANRTEPVALATVTTLDSLKKAFEQWEENLVEVPGMPHEHNHEHGKHEHHHPKDTTLKDLPADKMRDLQLGMLDNIRQIQERTEATFSQVTSILR